MGLTYIAISIFFTDLPLDIILQTFLLATGRMWLLVAIMSFYVISKSKVGFIHGLRSVKFQWGLKSRFGEDIILFFQTIFRFIPSIQAEWNTLYEGRLSLGLTVPESRMSKLKYFSKELPFFLKNTLRRSDEISKTMIQRGYGNQLPRSVFPYYPITYFDLMVILSILIMTSLI